MKCNVSAGFVDHFTLKEEDSSKQSHSTPTYPTLPLPYPSSHLLIMLVTLSHVTSTNGNPSRQRQVVLTGLIQNCVKCHASV